MIRGFGFLLVWCSIFFFFLLVEGNALLETFGLLDNLTKLNLDQNPLVIRPVEVVKEGVEAIKIFMAKRWLDILVEEERKSMLEMQEQTETGWLTGSTSWLKILLQMFQNTWDLLGDLLKTRFLISSYDALIIHDSFWVSHFSLLKCQS